MNRYGSIYLIEHTSSGGCYVGQTTRSVVRRWRAHVSASQAKKFKLSLAIAEFGEAAFSVTEVFVAFNKQALDAAEREWIASLNPVFNTNIGGAGRPRTYTSDSERALRSIKSREMWADPEKRRKLMAALFSPTVIARRTERVKQTSNSETTKQKKRLAMLGRKMPQDAVEKSAKAKHKPIICIELGLEFEAMKHAADYFGVRCSTVSEAVRLRRPISGQYTLERV